MNALSLLIIASCVYALAYRYYSAFLAAKVLALSDSRTAPAHIFNDGRNYVPTSKCVLFGHHFAAIAGAGPLIGPTLAAQFGYAPCFAWLVLGAVIAGAVQDFTVLIASTRLGGKSLVEIVRAEIGPAAGVVATIAVLFILLATLAGLGIVVVNALAHSPWGTFTVGMTIPIALGMGVLMFRGRGERIPIAVPSVAGVILLLGALIGGHFVANSRWASVIDFSPHQVTLLLALYGIIASVLPVWLLLAPRGYLSTYVKLGAIGALVLGILTVHPQIRFPATTSFVHGGGPIIRGGLFPFLFVTIACGAISGFHSLVSSGTTSKMLDKESDARFIGYGAMVTESLVGVMALIAACSMPQGDYFAINTTPEVFRHLGMHTVNLDFVSHVVGENLSGRTGGAVSLAVGMAQIFHAIPGMNLVLGYWYHFAILFEALFILTTVDTGTRVACYIFHELLGRAFGSPGKQESGVTRVLVAVLVTSAWGYLIYTGNISTIWPLFGTGNQLLATIALVVITVFLVNRGKIRLAWLTAIPAAFIGTVTVSAGVLSVRDILWPMTKMPQTAFQGYLDSALMVTFIAGAIFVVGSALRRIWMTLRGAPVQGDFDGQSRSESPVKIQCC